MMRGVSRVERPTMRLVPLFLFVAACGDKKPADPPPAGSQAAEPTPAKPAPPTPTRPPLLAAGAPVSPGCFAYSEKLDAWACLVGSRGRDGSELTREWKVAFPGATLSSIAVTRPPKEDDEIDEPVVLDQATHDRIEKLLAEHGFVAMPAATPLATGKSLEVGAGKLGVRRLRRDHANAGDGDFQLYHHTVEVRCKNAWVKAWTTDRGTDPAVLVSAPGKHLLVSAEISWGMEGAFFLEHEAIALSLDTCAPIATAP
jgi:hypothetical protein